MIDLIASCPEPTMIMDGSKDVIGQSHAEQSKALRTSAQHADFRSRPLGEVADQELCRPARARSL